MMRKVAQGFGGRQKWNQCLGQGGQDAPLQPGHQPLHPASALSAILDVEMNLHVTLCARWGLSPANLEQAPPAAEMLAYSRYVLDAGMRGDLLALKVALAPCVIGYAEIATHLATRPDARAATNPYRDRIDEYSGSPYRVRNRKR
jgi:thiaminase (transcriptional activator TenA)